MPDQEYFVAWWNVENLFSVESDPQRHPWLERHLGRELAGWDEEVLMTKIGQLASIIRQMNGGLGPDLLGVCEVENLRVLQRLVAAIGLPNRDYRIAHHDSDDKRGVDVAYIYDGHRLETRPDEVFHHIILKRTATRDLFQVNFYTRPNQQQLICIGNHWPARLGGILESEPYRMLAAETLAYWMTRIHEIHAQRDLESGAIDSLREAVPPAVVVMGDFNDEPHNRSMTDYALAERLERKVRSRRSRNPYLLNLMWPLMGSGHPTVMYDGEPLMLDQILVNRGLLDPASPWTLKRIEHNGKQVPHVGVVRMPEMVSDSGSNRTGPRRFSRPARRDYDPGGFSDHFPVAVKLIERLPAAA